MIIILALLVCCCLPPIAILTAMASGKNLTTTDPEVGGSMADMRLPFYTSGFE